MKALIHAAILAGASLAASAHAQTTFNAAVTSDYRYRGISQTRLQPALQGGADYAHSSGWYAGAWVSTIKWIEDAGGDGKLELDLYGGKRGEFAPGFSYDAGVLRYLYAGNELGKVSGFANAHTTEVYGQIGYGPAYVKYSHATTNLFGFVDSKGSGYLDMGASIDAGDGLTVQLHAGRQRVENNGAASYTDWKIGAARAYGPATVTLAVIGTNAGKIAYASPANGKFLGKSALQLTVGAIF
ncbi:TorF family putative porin [Massilia sp. IC2-477]|uniref:TorF family putative porin n=1 Tax=Massilia sp. IC2-477 TaxID=2887198 RepID=UPI001D12D28C|nr:TorF family putative porin [Massilia sp. IC2-477]MCC2954388.1 TorF family putative porin [Massilia sp. IC2-477]